MSAPSAVRAVANRTPASRRFGQLVRTHREGSGLTQFELGAKAGTTQQTVARWEAGLAVPGLQTIVELAEILGFSLDDLRGAA